MQHACVPLVLVKSLTASIDVTHMEKMQRPSLQLEDTLLTLQLLLSIIQNIYTSIHLPANLHIYVVFS